MAKHLVFEERIRICEMRRQGFSYQKIADALSRAKSTIREEVVRNTQYTQYNPFTAEEKARKKARKPRVRRKMIRHPLREFVLAHLKKAWSPEQIAGRLKLLHPRTPSERISAETIYKWIWTQKSKNRHWYKHLRTGLKKRRRHRAFGKNDPRGRMKGRVDIDRRPKSVDSRRFLGDWEGDTFVGRGGLGRIASWVERKTRYVCLAVMEGHKSRDLNKAILGRFKESPELPVRTVTLDNGHEFFAHLELCSAWGCQTYFAHPHHPWERGLNENSNGLLRQFFPKSRDLRDVSREELAEAERLLNTRPRKCLQYRTPEEVMAKMLARTRTD